MNQLLKIIISLIVISSCQNKSRTNENEIVDLQEFKVKDFKPNSNIEKFHIISGIYSEVQIEKMDKKTYWYLNEPTFNPKTDTIKYIKNSIYISYLTFNNGCDDLAGDFIEKGDSIKINLVNLNGYTCTERSCDRVVIQIKNPQNKKYKITKW